MSIIYSILNNLVNPSNEYLLKSTAVTITNSGYFEEEEEEEPDLGLKQFYLDF